MGNPQGSIYWNIDKPSTTIENNQVIYLINVTNYVIIRISYLVDEVSRVHSSEWKCPAPYYEVKI